MALKYALFILAQSYSVEGALAVEIEKKPSFDSVPDLA